VSEKLGEICMRRECGLCSTINALDIKSHFPDMREQIAPMFKQPRGENRWMHSRECLLFIIFRRKESPGDDREWYTAELNE